LVGFLVGAAVCASAISRWRTARGRLLAVVTTAELLLLAVALAIAAASNEPLRGTPQNLIVVVAAIALGMQNAAARELSVPDATTTVLTMTLTGFAADLRQRNGPVLLRRLLAVAAMLVGGVAGAALVLRQGATWALALSLALVALVCLGAWVLGTRPDPWQTRARRLKAHGSSLTNLPGA